MNTLAAADRAIFANYGFAWRQRHREFTNEDYDAVWFKAARQMYRERNGMRPSGQQVIERCFRILIGEK